MATQAEKKRASASVELGEAIRQAERYLSSHKPSVRLIKQKMGKVAEKEEELKEIHFSYCNKADIAVDSEDAMKFIQSKSDTATDCVDACMIFIEENEIREAENEKFTDESAAQREIEEKDKTRLQGWLAQITADERFVTELSAKIRSTVDAKNYTIDNMVLVKTYAERVQEILVSLNQSWNNLTLLYGTDENIVKTSEVTASKLSIQDTISSAMVFIEKCSNEESSKVNVRSEPSNETSATRQPHGKEMLKPEKIRLPTFSGNIRTFAKFRKDFGKIVIPFYASDTHRTYILKENCLKGTAKMYVENIDDINEIWSRLEQKYGDKLDLVDIVIKELDAIPTLRGNDDQKFIGMVDLLEKGLQDLEAIEARTDIANAYTVKMLESKLSRQLYLNWLKEEEKTEGSNRFEKLLTFLKAERKRIEKLVQRGDSVPPKDVKDRLDTRHDRLDKARSGHVRDEEQQRGVRNNCLIHPKAFHFTRKCRSFLEKSHRERAEIVKTTKGCQLCLSTSHIDKQCPWKVKWGPCKLDSCEQYHSHLLHEAVIQGFFLHLDRAKVVGRTAEKNLGSNTLLLIQKIPTDKEPILSFFDNGSTISLVSRSYVRRNSMKGLKVSYDLITVGGRTNTQNTYLHDVTLLDSSGNEHIVQAFEIEDICGRLKEVDVTGVVNLFARLNVKDVQRQPGPVELLIGMKHVNIHPKPLQEVEGMVLFESVFGSNRLLGGSHHLLKGCDHLNSFAETTATAQIKNTRVLFEKHLDPGIDFFTSEEFGVKVPPSCDRCRNCKKCTIEMHQMSKVEQRELTVIVKNLELNPIEDSWKTPYPYKVDPMILGDNELQVTNIQIKTETRILKSPTVSEQVKEQFKDFIKRGVFRKISKEELESYKGPVFYVTIHEIFKESSTSTPVRLVINSSLKYKGLSLNDVLMKGPNTLNDIFGVQLRFRCYLVPLVCDISKMYHRVKTTEVERHLRRVKWRDLDPTQEWKVYGIETVTFGDRPAAAISTVAVRKTAELYRDINPRAAERIVNDSYVDDITTGEEDLESMEILKKGIEEILSKGGFKVKGFVTSGDVSEETLSLLGSGEFGRVLGVVWDPRKDVFRVKVRINLSKKFKSARMEKDMEHDEIPSILNLKITRRILLSITNSCYDPYGLLAPISIQIKIALRNVCGKDIGWDDDLPETVKQLWVKILQKVKEAEQTTFQRCIKPPNAKGDPDLIVCNDGSELAMCATAHIRWECEDGVVWCQLWTAKTRVTPLRKLSIPKIEMQSAVLGARLAESIKKNAIWQFRKVYHIVDSECTLATLRKDSIALKEFMGNRVAEILDTTKVEQWYHVRSKDNIADLGTRDGATVDDISESSEWQNGTDWMHLPINEWPVNQDIGSSHVPEEELVQSKLSAHVTTYVPTFTYKKYIGKSYQFVVNLTARLLNIMKKKSFKCGEITVDDLKEAEAFTLKQSMRTTKIMLNDGKLTSLRPEEDSDGIIRLGGRALEGMKNCYENEDFPILAYEDPMSYLWMKKIHEEDHSGVTRTVAKSRRKFWIIKAPTLANKVKKSCYKCRLLDKRLAQQQMAPLPTSRQIMSPTFHEISLDLFGPYEIKDTVKQRTRKKVWGLIISCLATRAIHVDVTEDYGADAVLQSLGKFISLRGCPAVIYSDRGSQLMAVVDELKKWAVTNRIQWKAVPAEGQHQNGVSEALIKSIKRSLSHVIGNNILTFSGLQMVFYEVANLINSRPIGITTGSDPTQPTAITPNHLLLGRSTSEVVIGCLDNTGNANKRFKFLQTLIESWWKTWYETVLPSLVPSYKWHQRHRNVKPGDVCLIKYKNEFKGNYRLGRVKSVKKGDDGLVRTVNLVYKNPDENVFREVDRPIHGIAVIVPIEEQPNVIKSELNPKAKEFGPIE